MLVLLWEPPGFRDLIPVDLWVLVGFFYVESWQGASYFE